ncbi:hypothetical protein Dimus_002711 [Dionaea muscipula]
MIRNQQALLQFPWSQYCCIHLQYPPSPRSYNSPPSSLLAQCGLTRRGQRFLTSIVTTETTDPSAANRKIRKFVASSPKYVSLSTLTHLLSPSSTHPDLAFLTLPLYIGITGAPWFSWNSKLIADVIALQYKQGLCHEAERLTSETVTRLCSKERELVSFYSDLIDSAGKLRSEQGFFIACACLKQMISKSSSSSMYVKTRAYGSLIRGFCMMGLAHEAESMINEARCLGPSVFIYRCMVEGYGKLGLFDQVLRIAAEMEKNGFVLDAVSSNVILSSYGMHGDLHGMNLWVQKTARLGVGISIRTYNSVLNSCPTVIALLQDLKTCPTSMKDLMEILQPQGEGYEASLVQELIGSPVLNQLVEWNALESELDLHGMHLGTAYLILLQWMEELRRRFTLEEYQMPVKFTVICGVGKHSNVRGNSPVKTLVKALMLRTKSPLRTDRTNAGCLVAKGRAVRDWLSLC